jgi:hypothetical protein
MIQLEMLLGVRSNFVPCLSVAQLVAKNLEAIHLHHVLV